MVVAGTSRGSSGAGEEVTAQATAVEVVAAAVWDWVKVGGDAGGAGDVSLSR